MGCDIHVVLERRWNNRWVGVNKFEYSKPDRYRAYTRERNYQRFTALANVRGHGGLDPRGLPKDISDLTAMEVDGWSGDGHSHSWVTLDDALKIWLDTEFTERFDKEMLKRITDFPKYYYFGVEDDEAYRIVFWFDN